jgi:hypothetical protein
VEIMGAHIKLRTSDGEEYETYNPGDEHLIDDLLAADVRVRIKVPPQKHSTSMLMLLALAIALLLPVIHKYIKTPKEYIYLENRITGYKRQAPVGFSWTTLIFGFFPALIRGDWKWGIIMFLCSLVTFGLSQFIFCFIYNKLYLKDLLNDGYEIICVKNLEGKTLSN